MRKALPLLLVLCLAAACSAEEPAGSPDAGLSDAGLDAGEGADAGDPACGAGERANAAGGCVGVGWRTCAEGFEPAAGGGCAEILPAADCAPGTFPVLGERECQPVGTRGCVEGFEADPSGWGCRPILPAVACAGATREQLGSTGCVPVGDCAAAFPPAEATLFVDDSYGAAELDATHFATIGEAVAAAPDGATIALEEGTYREPLTLERPVTLVGRCAERVVLEGVEDGNRGVIAIGAAADAALSGMTITNFDIGVVVKEGARLEVADSVVEANRSFGLLVQEEGSFLGLRRSVTRGNLLNASGKYGDGAVAIFGGELLFEDSAAVGNHTAGVMAQNSPTRVTLRRAVIRDTLENAVGSYGAGIIATESSQVDLESSAIAGGKLSGVQYLGAKGSVRDTTISDVAMGADANGASFNSAVTAQGSEIALDGVTLSDCELHGLYLNGGAVATVANSVIRGTRIPAEGEVAIAVGILSGTSLEMTGSALVENHGVAIIGQGATVTLADTLVRGTVTMPEREGTGLGVSVREGAQLTAQRLALLDNAAAAFSILDTGSAATVEALVVADTRIANMVDQSSPYGIGVRVVDGSLDLRRAVVLRSAAAGMLVDAAGTVARVTDAVFRDTGLITDWGTHGYGIAAQWGPAVTLERVGIYGSRTIGLATWGAATTLTATELTISGTRADGRGDYGHGLVIGDGAAALSDALIEDSEQAGVVAADRGVRITLVDSMVRGRGQDAGAFGYGVLANPGSRLDLSGCTVADNTVGILYASATGAVSTTRVEGNGIAVNVSGASSVSEEPTLPAEVAENEVVVTSDSVFVGNETRLGAGTVPVPPIPENF